MAIKLLPIRLLVNQPRFVIHKLARQMPMQ